MLPSVQEGGRNSGEGLGVDVRLKGERRIAGKGIQEITPAVKHSEWAKSTNWETTMWETLPFSSGKDVAVLIAKAFDLDKTAKAIANLARIEGGEKRSANRRANRYPLLPGRFPFDFCCVSQGSKGNESVSTFASPQGQVGRSDQTSAEFQFEAGGSSKKS